METNLNSTSGNAGSSGADASLTQQAKQQTQQAVQKTQEVAGKVVDQAREQVKGQLETQKDRVAEGVQSVAQALRRGSEQLHEQQQDWLGRYADSAVEMVENIAGSLKQKNVDQLIGDIERFGRRQPGIFLLSAFALGFAATRFLKASGSNGNGHSYPGAMTANTHDRLGDYPAPPAYEAAPGGMTSDTLAFRETKVTGTTSQTTYVPVVTDDDEESADALETAGTLRE